MPDFQYIARELTGRKVNGVIAATNTQDALTLLAARQLFPLKVTPAATKAQLLKFGGRAASPTQLAILYSQLADLLKSGVPLLRSLELLNRQTQNAALKVVLQDIREQVADGTRLHTALAQHRDLFGELVVSMVRAGEEGGFLEDVLKRVAVFTEHQEELKGKVLGALIYPLFLLGFGSIVVVILLVKFVPRFEPIFERMKAQGDLPWATSTLLVMSHWTQNYWFIALLLMAGTFYGMKRWLATDDGRWKMDQFRIRVWGAGRIIKSLAISRFCRVLGTLLKNGVPILPSLRISKDATANAVLSRAIADAADNISAGKSLARPLSASGHFPEEIVEMIAVGEEANNLEQVLVDIAENLERRTYRELDLVVRMLEPIMLLILATVVLFVVVALLLPIMQTSGLV